MIITNQRERVGSWVADKIGNKTPWHLYEAIGIEKDGELIGGVVIDNYIHEARCSIHCAGIGRKWLNRKFLFIVFDYVFRQLKCNAVLNAIDGRNLDSIKFTSHLGFKEVHRVKGGSYNGADAVLFEMLKSDCRWIKPKEKK